MPAVITKRQAGRRNVSYSGPTWSWPRCKNATLVKSAPSQQSPDAVSSAHGQTSRPCRKVNVVKRSGAIHCVFAAEVNIVVGSTHITENGALK